MSIEVLLDLCGSHIVMVTHYVELQWAGNVARMEDYKEYATNRKVTDIFQLGIMF